MWVMKNFPLRAVNWVLYAETRRVKENTALQVPTREGFGSRKLGATVPGNIHLHCHSFLISQAFRNILESALWVIKEQT